jgi:hypothetical protein
MDPAAVDMHLVVDKNGDLNELGPGRLSVDGYCVN